MALERKSVWWRGIASSAMGVASHLGWKGATFQMDHLLQKAIRETGLDDFGPDKFLEPLRLLVRDFSTHNKTDTLGHVVFSQMILTSLKNRLNLYHVISKHPEVENVPVKAPLFVIGLPRTGTTFLQGLLSQVSTLRPLQNWETHQLPVPQCLATTKQVEQQIKTAQAQIDGVNRLSPEFIKAHELGTTEPEECNPFLMSSFYALLFCQLIYAPDYFQYVCASGFGDSYQMHKRHLQSLSLNRRETTWFLKGPAHLASLDQLLDVYPDARVVFTHRSPLECLPSMASLTSMLRMVCLHSQDLKLIGPGMMNHLKQMIDMGYRARDAWPSGATPFLDITYKKLVSNPLGTVHQILSHFDIPAPEGLDVRLEEYLKNRIQHRHGAHKYSLDEYGLDETEIKIKFKREADLAGD